MWFISVCGGSVVVLLVLVVCRLVMCSSVIGLELGSGWVIVIVGLWWWVRRLLWVGLWWLGCEVVGV